MKHFIIYLPQHTESVRTATITQTQLNDFNIKASLFEGTYGKEAVSRALSENRTLHPWGIKGPPEVLAEYDNSSNVIIKESPGVLGCFYSHYRLWEKCVDLGTPIAIWEDDIMIRRKFYPVNWKDVLILALGHPKKSPRYMHYLETPEGEPSAQDYYQASMPGCCGYAIKPHAAEKLLEVYSKTYLPADNAINQHHVTIQIHSHVMGLALTKKDGKVSLTRGSFWRKEKKNG